MDWLEKMIDLQGQLRKIDEHLRVTLDIVPDSISSDTCLLVARVCFKNTIIVSAATEIVRRIDAWHADVCRSIELLSREVGDSEKFQKYLDEARQPKPVSCKNDNLLIDSAMSD